MVIPPSYADLGKSARDLFSKGYNYGLFKVEAKTKTASGIEFNSNGSSTHDTGKFAGSLETKYKWRDYGLSLNEKWTTDNTLSTEVSVEDQLVQGLKLTFDTKFQPNTGKKSGKVKTEYKRDYFHGGVDADFSGAGSTLNGAVVGGYKGFLVGYQMALDMAKKQISQNNFAVGYSKDDITLHTSVKQGSEFNASVYHKVNPQVDAGVQLSWALGNNETTFGVATKYQIDKDTTFRAKLSSSSQVGLSYQQAIRKGVTLTLSTLIEGKNLSNGGHKYGLGLEFEA